MIRDFLVSRIMKFQILMVSIILGLVLFPNIVSEQLTGQQLEVVKLEREIELLNQQIKNSDPLNILYTQIIPIVGGILIAGSTVFFTWQHERRIPPNVEQERIIQDIIKEWYSRNYLNAYHRIWKEIEDSNNDENKIDKYWKRLSSKKFPEEYLIESKKDLFDQINYFRKKLHLGNNFRKKLRKKLHLGNSDAEEIERRIEAIRNSADVEYYTTVRLVLPTIVDAAVMATIDSKDKSTASDFADKDYESLVESSLKKLKKLMIFYRIRENKEVCEILIRAKLNEKRLNLDSTSTDGTLSGGEI
jgi:hypothetical protein